MKVVIKVKPYIMKSKDGFRSAANKQEFMERIKANFKIAMNGSCYTTYLSYRERDHGKKDRKFAIHLEKRNPVNKQTKFKNGKTRRTKRIAAGYWIASIYSFPIDFPVDIVQHARHFTLKQTSNL